MAGVDTSFLRQPSDASDCMPERRQPRLINGFLDIKELRP